MQSHIRSYGLRWRVDSLNESNSIYAPSPMLCKQNQDALIFETSRVDLFCEILSLSRARAFLGIIWHDFLFAAIEQDLIPVLAESQALSMKRLHKRFVCVGRIGEK